MTVLVLTSAGAARARRRLPALRQSLPESDTLRHHVTQHPGELAALLGHDRWRPEDLLVINGGDGSVQHALTRLLANCPAQRLPRIACLPGGTTNMTAFDINLHRRFDPCVETLQRAAATATAALAPRSVVRVQHTPAGDAGGTPRGGHPPGGPAPGGPPRCGLFFGIGTIVRGIEYFQDRLRERLERSTGGHEFGAGMALARALWGIARRQPPFDEPLQVRVGAAFAEASAGAFAEAFAAGRSRGAAPEPGHPDALAVRLLFVTALDRLFLGIRPHWGAGSGALKCTAVEARATRLTASLPRLLRGQPDAHMTPGGGYHSCNLNRISLEFSGSYTLDGELFANPGETIIVSATDPVRFVPL